MEHTVSCNCSICEKLKCQLQWARPFRCANSKQSIHIVSLCSFWLGFIFSDSFGWQISLNELDSGSRVPATACKSSFLLPYTIWVDEHIADPRHICFQFLQIQIKQPLIGRTISELPWGRTVLGQYCPGAELSYWLFNLEHRILGIRMYFQSCKHEITYNTSY